MNTGRLRDWFVRLVPRGGPAPPMSPDTAPWWVGFADAVVVSAFVVGLFVALGDRIQVRTPLGRISATSPVRPWALALVACTLRHLVRRRPAIHEALWAAGRALVTSADWRAVFPVAASTRVVVLVTGLLAVSVMGYHAGAPPRLMADDFWNLPARWDAGWYSAIAIKGYTIEQKAQQPIAFFPAFPTVMRVAAEPLELAAALLDAPDLAGGRTGRLIVGGLATSLLAFTWGLVFVFRIAKAHLGEERARSAVLLLASYPFAVFFSAPYTEGLFLLGSAAAMYRASEGRWMRAAGWGLLVGLTRPNGFLLSVPLFCLAYREWRTGSGSKAAAIGAASPVIGMLIFSAFVRSLTGHAFAWAAAQSAWDRKVDLLQFAVRRLHEIAGRGVFGYLMTSPMDALAGAAVLLALSVIWLAFRRFGVAYGMLIAVNLLPPLAIDLPAVGRMTAVLFPLFMALAAQLPPRSVAWWVSVFGVLQGLTAAVFFCSGPLF